MSQQYQRQDPYAQELALPFEPAVYAAAGERALFIKRTYLHVAGALVAFAGLLTLFVSSAPPEFVKFAMAGRGTWLVIMVLFMIGTGVASRMAQATLPMSTQYMGLGLMVLLQALIFTPLVWLVGAIDGNFSLIYQAAILTLALAAGLTLAVFVTGKDFSFLGGIVSMGAMIVIGAILVSCIFPITLGFWFCMGVIALMSAAILYQSSMVLHHYPTTGYVGAALAVYATIMTMFWYVIQALLLSRRN
jgi:FtsH-binding integral membrane protein